MRKDANGQRYTKRGKRVANQDIISKIKNCLAEKGVWADLVHIRREDNKIADQLAKMAKDFSASETRSVRYSSFMREVALTCGRQSDISFTTMKYILSYSKNLFESEPENFQNGTVKSLSK